MTLKLIGKVNETQDVKTFIFRPQTNLGWKAGQYLIYFLPHKNQDLRGKMRFFTVSSAPFEENVHITTRIEKTGGSSFKKELNSLRIGDEIEAKGPDGDFFLKNIKKEYVFIAGGIGITPFISILRQLNRDKKSFNVNLLYANRSWENIPFKKELEEIAAKRKTLKIRYFISPEKIDKKVLKSYVIKKRVFYISGPEPMVETFEKILSDLGVPANRLKQDYFPGYKDV